ncbi:MAG TPA: hypothetical protein VFT82_02210 [Candidatus Paceibacterota bacterium]|nr:hypothetical protein [Candidatus Paceibacterota bacterium]
MKFLIWLISSLICFVCSFCAARVDLFFNPWICSVAQKMYEQSMFTSNHWTTAAYLVNFPAWLTVACIGSAAAGIFITLKLISTD